MKANTIWTIIGIIVLIAIVFGIYKYTQTQKANSAASVMLPETKKVVSPGIVQGVSTSDLNAQLI